MCFFGLLIVFDVQHFDMYFDRDLHHVSKKLCQLIVCSSVKYEPISLKIGRIVPEETLNKTVSKMATLPKVCACTTLGNLKCRIERSTQ